MPIKQLPKAEDVDATIADLKTQANELDVATKAKIKELETSTKAKIAELNAQIKKCEKIKRILLEEN